MGARSGRCNPSNAVQANPPSCTTDRVSRSEGLDALPADYSKLPALPPDDCWSWGHPLPATTGPAINSQQPVAATYAAPGYDPNDALRKQKRLPLHRYSSHAAGRARGAVAGRCRTKASLPMPLLIHWMLARPRRRPSCC